MLRNKKGLESPRVIVYTIYVSIIMIIGIFLILGLTSNVCTVSSYRLANMDFNSISTKMLYSGDCYARVYSYPDDNPTSKPNPGMLVKSRLLNGDKFHPTYLDRCIDLDEGDYELKLEGLSWDASEKIDKTELATIGDGCSLVSEWNRIDSTIVNLDDGTDAVLTMCIKSEAFERSEGACD